jgi:low temperature requirement protein LtrA
VLLAIIVWMYGGYAWLTNAVAADTAARRLVLLGGMAGFLLVSLTVPEAFDGGGLAFGLAYAVVVLVHIGLFTRTQRVRSASDLVRVGLLNVAGTALIVVGGTIGGGTQLVLWILVPLVWWLVAPYRGLSGGFDIGAAHFVERHGLVLIIAIGESLVGLALGLGDLELGPSVAVVAVLGLALSACLVDVLRRRRHPRRASTRRGTSRTSRSHVNRGIRPCRSWAVTRCDRDRRWA